MTEWRRVSLGDVANLSNGANFTKDSFGSGLRIIGVRDFGDRLYPDWSATDQVQRSAVSSDRALLAEGDLLFVRSNGNRALVGRCLLVTPGPEATHSAFTIRARPDRSQVMPRFLAYQMRHAHREGQMLAASGTNITNLNQSILAGVPVLLPELPDQARIVSILASIDDLIENNRRRVEVLEEMARAIYREWFVRFRYPGHEDVPLVDSPHGPIPDGWTVRPLIEVADITMGQSPKSEFYNSDSVGKPFHQGVTDFGRHYPTHRKFCTIDARLAQDGDMLVSVRAPVGRINLADTTLVIGRGLAAVRSTAGRQSFMVATLGEVFAEEDSMGGGTIFKAIGKKELEQIPVLQPPDGLVAAADDRLAAEFRLIRSLTFASRELAAIRDLLLPKLVTGQIDVSQLDLDALTEAASA